MNVRAVFLSLFLLQLTGIQAQQHKVRSYTWKRVEVTSRLDSLPSQEEALSLISTYKSAVDSIISPALGLSRVAMSAERPESLLGNWAADVVVEGATATGLNLADMGLFNVGGLRSDMPEGIVRCGDIMKISPFDNYVVVLEMKGKDMLKLMKEVAAIGGECVSKEVRMEISPAGKLLSCTIGGEEIQPKRIYKVATIDYLAEGNNGLTSLRKAVKRHDIGILTRDIMMEYVIKHRVIDSKLEGRIKVSKEN